MTMPREILERADGFTCIKLNLCKNSFLFLHEKSYEGLWSAVPGNHKSCAQLSVKNKLCNSYKEILFCFVFSFCFKEAGFEANDL